MKPEYRKWCQTERQGVTWANTGGARPHKPCTWKEHATSSVDRLANSNATWSYGASHPGVVRHTDDTRRGEKHYDRHRSGLEGGAWVSVPKGVLFFFIQR